MNLSLPFPDLEKSPGVIDDKGGYGTPNLGFPFSLTSKRIFFRGLGIGIEKPITFNIEKIERLQVAMTDMI